jgi:hypothetical protein
VALADECRRLESFVGEGGWHLDVDEPGIGCSVVDQFEQAGQVSGSAGNVESGVSEQPGEATRCPGQLADLRVGSTS